ncbi:hypothetical protein Ahy_A06g028864 [Arachis hypogaea]|uniref:Uncharacterized protein n=1 Tax=Arachis hypogaea TaxID=3818 RepID=A0A445CS12_ARAHY|nr:hypothetical protein Ahy_A06g028864 [Arachis hypogaea]
MKQCVAETPRAQCGGGIIINPGFDHSIDGLTKGMLCSFTGMNYEGEVIAWNAVNENLHFSF